MHRVSVIPGDGIGPAIVAAARRVVEATGVDVEWREVHAGSGALERLGDPLPEATFDAIAETGVALKGPCETPVGEGFRSVNVALRKHFTLYANVRPVRAFEGVPCLFPGLDLVVVRENLEGFYSSMEHWIGPGRQSAMAIGVNTRPAMERVCRFAFRHAEREGRRKVTAVHKANILKILSGLFLEVAREVATEFPRVAFEDRIIDAMAMQMVRDPGQFDVIVTTNMFGDILSDLAAGLVGGLGVAPGANLGDDVAIFEAVHGTAPDIAGKDLANPTSIILAGSMLLRHLGESAAASRIERAVGDVLAEGTHVTRDLNREHGVGTVAMTDAIVARIQRPSSSTP